MKSTNVVARIAAGRTSCLNEEKGSCATDVCSDTVIKRTVSYRNPTLQGPRRLHRLACISSIILLGPSRSRTGFSAGRRQTLHGRTTQSAPWGLEVIIYCKTTTDQRSTPVLDPQCTYVWHRVKKSNRSPSSVIGNGSAALKPASEDGPDCRARERLHRPG